MDHYRIKEYHKGYHVFGRYWSYRRNRYGIVVEGTRAECQAYLKAYPGTWPNEIVPYPDTTGDRP